MSTTSSPVRAEVAWVRALALGLGYAAKPDEICVQEVLTGARGSIVTLREARKSLDTMAVTDLAARQRTCRILESASRLALDQPARHSDPSSTPNPADRSVPGFKKGFSGA